VWLKCGIYNVNETRVNISTVLNLSGHVVTAPEEHADNKRPVRPEEDFISTRRELPIKKIMPNQNTCVQLKGIQNKISISESIYYTTRKYGNKHWPK
jgi:hypothetical protein